MGVDVGGRARASGCGARACGGSLPPPCLRAQKARLTLRNEHGPQRKYRHAAPPVRLPSGMSMPPEGSTGIARVAKAWWMRVMTTPTSGEDTNWRPGGGGQEVGGGMGRWWAHGRGGGVLRARVGGGGGPGPPPPRAPGALQPPRPASGARAAQAPPSPPPHATRARCLHSRGAQRSAPPPTPKPSPLHPSPPPPPLQPAHVACAVGVHSVAHK